MVRPYQRLDKRLVVSSVLLLGVMLVLYRAAFGQFFWSDDFVLLTYVRDHTPLELLATGSFGDRSMPYCRPGWYLLFKLLYNLFGTTPGIYLATSLALHFATAILVLLVAAKTTGHTLLGFAAGLLFLSSPAYMEGVTWIAAALNVPESTETIHHILEHMAVN